MEHTLGNVFHPNTGLFRAAARAVWASFGFTEPWLPEPCATKKGGTSDIIWLPSFENEETICLKAPPPHVKFDSSRWGRLHAWVPLRGFAVSIHLVW